MLGQRFSNHAKVRIAFLHAENRCATHAVQWFENDVAVFLPEGFQLRFITRDQRFRRQVSKPGGEQLFVAVAQALRFVDDKRPFLFCTFQNIGCVDELGIKRRILTHQNDVQVCQREILFALELIPFVVVLLYAQGTRAGAGFTVVQIKIGHLHIMNFVTATLRFQQHSEAGVFLDVDACDGIHHDAELDHCSSPLAQIAKTHLKRSNGGERSCLSTQNARS